MKTPSDQLGKGAKGIAGSHRSLNSPCVREGLGKPTKETSNVDRNRASPLVILKNGQQPA